MGVWALCKGIQELYRANWAFQTQAQKLQKHVRAHNGAISNLKGEVGGLRQRNAQLEHLVSTLQQKGGDGFQAPAPPGMGSQQSQPTTLTPNMRQLGQPQNGLMPPPIPPFNMTADMFGEDKAQREVLSSIEKMLQMSIESNNMFAK